MSAPAQKAIPVWTIDDGRVSNIRIERSAPPPPRTKLRPRLTPEQRGRFWQSVVDTSAAAKTTHPRGYEQGEVSHG